MSKLSLDRDTIDLAKRFAEQIVNPVQQYIDRHTSVSIERCVLRLLGVSGSAENNPKGDFPQGQYPLVNEVTRVLGNKRLARGAGYWFGLVAVQNPGKNSNEIARLIVDGAVDLDSIRDIPLRDISQACQKLLRPQLDQLRRAREKKGNRPRFGHGGQPLRYVIVATGNIQEDIRQAQAAAEMGADIIAVIRSTAQSLLDHVPEGATTEGYGGTFATQDNFRLMREALDESEKKLRRRIGLCNYSSGLCMPEIAVIGALEGVEYLLNDAMYGILFRDINMKRNFVDQFFSRRICALSGITIQTGEDNYLTTAESYKYWFQVLGSHYINQAFAKRAGIGDSFLALGHAFEMDPQIEDSILYEWAQAQLVRELFPRAPIKFMPPTKHKTGDIFFSYLYDGMFNLAGAITGQTIQLLGMHTEAIHNPYIQDRYLSLKNANYIFNAAKGAKDEISFQTNGKVARRARQVLDDAVRLLKKVKMRGMFRAIEEGAFANVRRQQSGGKGLDGVVHKDRNYYTPLQSYLTPRALREEVDRDRRYGDGGDRRRTRTPRGRGRPERGRPAPQERKPAKRRELRGSGNGQEARNKKVGGPRNSKDVSRRPVEANRRPAETAPKPSEAAPRPAGPRPRPTETAPRPAGPKPRPGGTASRLAGPLPKPAEKSRRSAESQRRPRPPRREEKKPLTPRRPQTEAERQADMQREFHKQMQAQTDKPKIRGTSFPEKTPALPRMATPSAEAGDASEMETLPRRTLKVESNDKVEEREPASEKFPKGSPPKRQEVTRRDPEATQPMEDRDIKPLPRRSLKPESQGEALPRRNLNSKAPSGERPSAESKKFSPKPVPKVPSPEETQPMTDFERKPLPRRNLNAETPAKSKVPDPEATQPLPRRHLGGGEADLNVAPSSETKERPAPKVASPGPDETQPLPENSFKPLPRRPLNINKKEEKPGNVEPENKPEKKGDE